jgi:hypothetical protein
MAEQGLVITFVTGITVGDNWELYICDARTFSAQAQVFVTLKAMLLQIFEINL